MAGSFFTTESPSKTIRERNVKRDHANHWLRYHHEKQVFWNLFQKDALLKAAKLSKFMKVISYGIVKTAFENGMSWLYPSSRICSKNIRCKLKTFYKYTGTLVVWRLRLRLPRQEVQVWFLVRELRSRVFQGQESQSIKQKQYCKKNSVKTLKISSVQSLSRVRLFVTPWTAGHQPSLFITNSQSLLKLMSIKSLVPSNHLILCGPLLVHIKKIFKKVYTFLDLEYPFKLK